MIVKKPRKLKDMVISAIALVDKAANRKKFLLFKQDGGDENVNIDDLKPILEEIVNKLDDLISLITETDEEEEEKEKEEVVKSENALLDKIVKSLGELISIAKEPPVNEEEKETVKEPNKAPDKKEDAWNFYVCPKCGYTVKKEKETPHKDIECPECKVPLKGSLVEGKVVTDPEELKKFDDEKKVNDKKITDGLAEIKTLIGEILQ